MVVAVESNKLIQVRNHLHKIMVLVVEAVAVELDSLLEMVVYLHKMLLVVVLTETMDKQEVYLEKHRVVLVVIMVLMEETVVL